jgi:heat shock protein HtpX
VLGHEISHVGNRDILIASVAAGLASMIMFLVGLAQLGALFGFGGSDEDSGPGLLEIVLISLLGPLTAGLTHAVISRSREYAADAAGAEVTGEPIALASALAKLERTAQVRLVPPTGHTAPVSALMIVNPFSGRAAATGPRHLFRGDRAVVARGVRRAEHRAGEVVPANRSAVDQPRY